MVLSLNRRSGKMSESSRLHEPRRRLKREVEKVQKERGDEGKRNVSGPLYQG